MMSRQDWRDFFITVFFLGSAFLIALLSTVAADQHAPRVSAAAAGLSLLMAALGALYIVPRLARRVQLEFLRFAVRTSVTGEGALFIVFLVIIAFAAWNTANNLLYLVLSALIAFLLAANYLARMSLSDVSVQLRFPDHIFAGEPANLTVAVTNHKRLLPSLSLMVEAITEDLEKELAERRSVNGRVGNRRKSGDLDKLAHYILVPAKGSAKQRIEHTFNRRGRYPITSFRVSTKFPTGFFKKWRKIQASGEIVVYPKPQPLDDSYHTLPMLAGQIGSHSRGSGDDLYSIRRYQPSDQMRHIDWKATAKSLELMVREHIREDERRLTIVLDTLRPELSAENDFEERFERAVVRAASLAHHFILERSDVELVSPVRAHNVPSGSGHEHLYRILRSLATIQLEAADGKDLAPPEKQSTWRKFTLPSILKRRRGQALAEDHGERAVGENTREHASRLLSNIPVLADERRFKVLITSMPKGTIPANVWRSAHVVFMEDL